MYYTLSMFAFLNLDKAYQNDGFYILTIILFCNDSFSIVTEYRKKV